MLATIALLWRCYGAAAVLPWSLALPGSGVPWRFGRGNIGAGPLERVFAAVDDLARPDEDPRTGRGVAELLDVKVRDVAPASHRAGQRDAPAAPSHPEDKGELFCRPSLGPECLLNWKFGSGNLEVQYDVN